MNLHETLTTSNEAGVEFVETELSLANTFLDVAETSTVAEHRFKSHQDTLKAYQSVLHLVSRLQLSTEQKLDFEQSILKLRGRMLLAGIDL